MNNLLKENWYDFVKGYKDFRSILFANPSSLYHDFEAMKAELVELRAFKASIVNKPDINNTGPL